MTYRMAPALPRTLPPRFPPPEGPSTPEQARSRAVELLQAEAIRDGGHLKNRHRCLRIRGSSRERPGTWSVEVEVTMASGSFFHGCFPETKFYPDAPRTPRAGHKAALVLFLLKWFGPLG